MTDRIAFRDWVAGGFGLALVANTVWINLSEVFRYFVVVIPMLREDMSAIANVAPMSLSIVLIWGVWDTILTLAVTGFCWLVFRLYGASWRTAAVAGTAFWCAVFVILWIGVWNMNLASGRVVAAALPLAWFEMIVAALIAAWAAQRGGLNSSTVRARPSV